MLRRRHHIAMIAGLRDLEDNSTLMTLLPGMALLFGDSRWMAGSALHAALRATILIRKFGQGILLWRQLD